MMSDRESPEWLQYLYQLGQIDRSELEERGIEVPRRVEYRMRALIKRRDELGRPLTEEEAEEFVIQEY